MHSYLEGQLFTEVEVSQKKGTVLVVCSVCVMDILETRTDGKKSNLKALAASGHAKLWSQNLLL